MSGDVFEDDEDGKKSKSNPDALAIRNILKDEGGRAYIWKHLQSCGVFENIFNIDPIQHGYNAGLREAGLRLERDIKEYEPFYYMKMIKENIDG